MGNIGYSICPIKYSGFSGKPDQNVICMNGLIQFVHMTFSAIKWFMSNTERHGICNMKKEGQLKTCISTFIAGSLVGLILLLSVFFIAITCIIVPLILHFTGAEYQSVAGLILFSIIMNGAASILEIILIRIISERYRWITLFVAAISVALLVALAWILDWVMTSLQLTFTGIMLVSALLSLFLWINIAIDRNSDRK